MKAATRERIALKAIRQYREELEAALCDVTRIDARVPDDALGHRWVVRVEGSKRDGVICADLLVAALEHMAND